MFNRIKDAVNKYILKYTLKKIGLVLVVLIILGGIFTGGYYLGRGKNIHPGNRIIAYSEEAANVGDAKNGQAIDFNLYWEVWDNLKTDYVDRNMVKDQDLFYGSLKGLAAAVGDPYTVFMDPKESKQFSDDLAGTFEGIGAEVGMRNDITTIIAPLDGMPAQKAGVRAGDKVYAVDGVSTLGLTVNEVVTKIRGPKDTKVTITIIRGKEKPRDITITRSVIIVKSVKTEMRADGIYVIRVSNFNDDTEDLFNLAVNNILLKEPKGIILDLRNNPGGYLETAVMMASEWVEAGPIVAEQFNGNRRNEYPSNGRGRLKNIPTIVLVNGGSASASEILAGALRDYKKATIVGETTYGKGSVQSLSDLSGGAALKMTIANWLTPAGDFINEKGLAPNIEVKLTPADADKGLDPQFDKAVELLKAKKK
ncbi:MAG: S41 family peptidase [Candidatus Falkowbacteria bacterium]|nr:S41 family peptidase [Candidatus Falkowbacteria bacterium]